jgi:Mrp family chromosome partitioning ATPase
LAFITEYSNHKIKSIEELENGVGLENAIAFSTIDTKKAYRQVKAEVRTQPDVSLQLSPRTLSKNVTVWVYLREEVREFFENVRDMVFTELKKTAKTSSKAPYVLAVTSTYRGEGTSTIATGLAYTISLFENSNVLLVDSNTHHPNVDKVTGINRPKGLYEMNVSGVAGNDSGNGLHSMLSGNMSDYVNKVKAPDKIGSLLPAVEKMEYRIIILDLPSLSEGAAAAKAAGIADGTLLVVESERVRREVLQRAKEKLNKSGANIVGSVLNKRRYYIPKWIYQRF